MCINTLTLTAQVFSEGIVFFVTLPQARPRCSPVRQVLLTGSVNINKTSSSSVPTPAVARQAAMQMQALRKQQAGPAACQPADR